MKKEDKLAIKKAVALCEAADKVEKYRSCGFDNNLCTTIFVKKDELIKNAKTIEDINQIMKGPIPFDDSGYTVPEEEAIMWSEASLKAPLNSQAFDRYLSLMKKIYGEELIV